MIFFKKQLEYYKSIDDMPIYNWFKLQETNDVSFMLINRKTDLNELKKNILIVAFDTLFRQYIDKFGIPEAMESVLNLKRDIEVLKLDMILSKDKSLINFIEIKERELKKIIDKKNVSDFNEVCFYIEKDLGFKLDKKTVSVSEFYTYLNTLKKQKNERQNKA